MGEEDDITWLPPADILNLTSMVVAMVGVFVLPILGIVDLNFTKLSFGLAGHYDMYNNKTPRSFLYFTSQEKVVVAITTILVIVYLMFAVIHSGD